LGAAFFSHGRDRGEGGEIFSGNAFDCQVPARGFTAQTGGGNAATRKSDSRRSIEAQGCVGSNVGSRYLPIIHCLRRFCSCARRSARSVLV
jgi:hypothetical protein